MRLRPFPAVLIAAAAVLTGCGDDEQTRGTTTTSAAVEGPTTLLVCLEGDATDAEVRTLFDRASMPSSTGVGTDLLDGIAGVAARTRGIAVELDPQITPAHRDELVAIFGADPVSAVREAPAECP